MAKQEKEEVDGEEKKRRVEVPDYVGMYWTTLDAWPSTTPYPFYLSSSLSLSTSPSTSSQAYSSSSVSFSLKGFLDGQFLFIWDIIGALSFTIPQILSLRYTFLVFHPSSLTPCLYLVSVSILLPPSPPCLPARLSPPLFRYSFIFIYILLFLIVGR